MRHPEAATASSRIHPDYQQQMHLFGPLVAGAAIITLLAWWLPLHRIIIPDSWYLPGHVLMEMATITISLLIFATTWNARRRGAPWRTMLLACLFLAAGLLDLLHMMTFEGMELLVLRDPANVSILFGQAARAPVTLGMLCIILLPEEPARRPSPMIVLTATLTLVGLLSAVILAEPDWLPVVYQEEDGLLQRKVAIELLLAVASLTGAVILFRRMRSPRPYHLPALWAALVIMAMGCLLFASYDLLGDLNLGVAHAYKVLAYALLFRALFVESVDLPYHKARSSEEKLNRLVAEQRLAAVAFETQVAIMVTDANQRILRVNRAFTEITGYTPEEVVGETPRILSSGLQSRSFYAEMWAQLSRTGRWEGEMWNRRKSGEPYPEHLVISAVTDDQGDVEFFVANFGDLTNAKEAEKRIHTLAYYDPLTRLANRRMLRDHIYKAQAGRSGRHALWALLLVDIDHFKSLNDSYGHSVGDIALQRVAERLLGCTRDSDIVARPGGDEFAILLGGLDKGRDQAVRAAQDVAAKVLEQLRRPLFLEGSSWSARGSIGIVLFNGAEHEPDQLIGQAEIAMYESKKQGGNTWRFFDPEMQEQAQKRSRLEEDLGSAVERNQLQLYCQIKLDRHGKIDGCEGLLRWQHPERGLVPPDQFIPVAEESGLIVPIGRWVIREACRILQEWQKDPARQDWTLAINISGRQLAQPEFVDEVREQLEECAGRNGRSISGSAPLASGQLEFEITESLLMEDMERSADVIRQLSALGVVFAMDDFGTGYSSLSYLKMLPLQSVKVDKSFVHDMLEDPGDAAIVEMVIALAKTLDLSVVAEGVEHIEQHRKLVELGCDYLQGYLYGRPVPEGELPDQSAIDQLGLDQGVPEE